MMKTHVQGALVIAMVLYLLWGLGLIVAPQAVHATLTTGPYDPTSFAMFGAALLGFASLFMIAAHTPERETIHAAAVALVFLGLTAGYLMFVAKTMPTGPYTVMSLAINLGVAVYLLISLTEAAANIGPTASKPSARAKKTKTRRRAAPMRTHPRRA